MTEKALGVSQRGTGSVPKQDDSKYAGDQECGLSRKDKAYKTAASKNANTTTTARTGLRPGTITV